MSFSVSLFGTRYNIEADVSDIAVIAGTSTVLTLFGLQNGFTSSQCAALVGGTLVTAVVGTLVSSYLQNTLIITRGVSSWSMRA
jgi:CBS-domain-containing membrane protein